MSSRNRRFCSFKLAAGVQNMDGSQYYEHQSTEGPRGVVQTWPDTVEGFRLQTEFQQQFFIGVMELANRLLNEQRDQVLEAALRGQIEIQGEDL